MRLFYILFFIFSVLGIFAINYFAEVNRFVLLLVVYPLVGFLGIGLAAIYERR